MSRSAFCFFPITLLWPALLCPLAGSTQPPAQPAPQPVLLWPQGAPLARGKKDKDQPSLTPFLVTGSTQARAGVVICPGGGYAGLATGHEGKDVARWFNEQGLQAFVLKYRLGSDGYRHPAPLLDARRAIRSVRARASEWSVAPNRVGIIGFSAGGHLASTLATHFDGGSPEDPDPVEQMSSRPDFLILGYPVISLEPPEGHLGSRRRLLGKKPDSELVRELSNHTQVTSETPPTFLVHTDEDRVVSADNSVLFYLALRRAGVPAELHIYQHGGHGLGLAPGDPVFSSWADRLRDWMDGLGLIDGEE